MSSKPKPPRRIVLPDIDWRTYSRLLRTFAERPGVRLAYDRGRLEIVSPLPEHESDSDFLGRMVVVLTEELSMPIKAGRSTTYRRRRQKRGIEPDNSYWITNEPKVRGKRRIDLRVDPPPDVAIEVDCTSSSLDRMSIYASIQVPEVWRLERAKLSFHILHGKEYREGSSQVFPGLQPQELLPFMTMRATMDENEVIRAFRVWIRERFGK